MFATASPPIHLDDRFRPAVMAGAALSPRLAARQTTGLNVSRPLVAWRWRTAIVDAIELVGVVWSLPFVIIAIGAPLALAMVALLWVARWALGAF
jgi:hypothetical protein